MSVTPEPGHPGAADDIFDRFASLVQGLLDVPVALVSLLEARRQIFAGAAGLTGRVAAERTTPITESVCRLVVGSQEPLVVNDIQADPRTAGFVEEDNLGVGAYAGVPVHQNGVVVGALCAIDHDPRFWQPRDVEILTRLARLCSQELDQHTAQRSAEQARLMAEGARDAALQSSEQALAAARASDRMVRHSRLLLALSEALAATSTIDDVRRAVEKTAREFLGASTTELIEDGEQPPTRFGAGPVVRRVPLAGGAGFRGSLVLTWAEDAVPSPTEDDPGLGEVLPALANYTASAIDRAHLLQERRDAATTLQHAMLTQVPPRDDVELAARYRPATTLNQVGGDWYDVIELEGRDFALVIGDVAGHDLEAAARMGELRNMLRALTLDRRTGPADLLHRLDTICTGLRRPVCATAAVAVVTFDDQPGARISWSVAGHPRPAVITGEGVVQLDGEPDLVLGIDAEVTRRDHGARLAPGATLLLYTDGLISRPGMPSDNTRLLLEACRRRTALSLPDFVDALLDDVGAEEDDCALVALRLPLTP